MKVVPESALSSPHGIAVHIDERFQARVELETLRRAALMSLIHECVEDASELTIVVTDDESLQDLNSRHRDIDAPTDVLAFSNESQGPFVGAPGLPRYLGDIVISFQRAEAQALHAGHAVQAELQLLVVHGVLHLLGYDDVTEEQRARMWEAQAAILIALGVELQLPA